MAGITFRVEIDEMAARERLKAIVERLDEPFDFYKRVGEYFTNEAVPHAFASESAPDGTPWASLSQVTIARREKAGQTPIQILTATKNLSASIISQPRADAVEIGSAVVYAGTMQFGAAKGSFGAAIGRTKPSEKRPRSQDYFVTLPWGDIPARPFLGMGPSDEVEIIRIASDWLDVE